MSTAHVGWAIGGGVMAAAIAAATTWSAGAHPAPERTVAASNAPSATAPSTTAPSTTVTSPAAASSASSSSESSAASSTQTAQAQVQLQAQAQGQAQLQAAQLNAELTGLARQLPAGVQLTAPAAWTSWTGAHPSYAHDVDGCPRIADRLGAALGGRWRYAQGTLPGGPDGCSWTAAAGGVVVGVGFERGSLPGAPTSSVPCDRTASVPVPVVRPGALLLGCDTATGRTLTLALPDTGGTGVFLLHAGGGPAVTGARASAALLAVVSAARRAYP